MLLNLLPVCITLGGGYFLIRLRAFFLFHPKKTLACVRAHCRAEGGSAFRRMSLALAGTLGVGNIIGVAAGILVGGAGSVFWLFLSALFSAPLKYAESVAVISVRKKGQEKNYGFPSFIKCGLPLIGAPLSKVYAVLSIALALFMGSAFQSAAVKETSRAFGIPFLPFVVVGSFVILLAFSLFFSSKRISSLTAILIPFSVILYTIICIFVIIFHISRISCVVGMIMKSAFSFRSFAGGTVGGLAASPLREGFLRGLLSNEAGAGTSAYAHAKSERPSPVAEGILGMGEIVFDTLLLCMLTAFAILLSVEDVTVYTDGTALLSAAFSSVLGRWHVLPLLLSVFLFALSTAVCWYEYGRLALSFLGHRGESCFLLSYLLAAGVGAVLGSMAVIPLCDTVLLFLTGIALAALTKNGAAICRLTKSTLQIGSASWSRAAYDGLEEYNPSVNSACEDEKASLHR